MAVIQKWYTKFENLLILGTEEESNFRCCDLLHSRHNRDNAPSFERMFPLYDALFG